MRSIYFDGKGIKAVRFDCAAYLCMPAVFVARGSGIYITNIVKYRPPNNRDPLPEEKLAFLPYLKKQIAIIKPKIIVTLGRHSGLAFLPDLFISREHGQAKRIKVMLEHTESKLVILPLYHPAAALYNGGLRATLLEDFAVIPSLLKQINNNETK
jgi:DNA polymerase